MKIYTRKGDDGTTGLLYGGRVTKDSTVIEANGAVDEAQAALGTIRAEVEKGSELDELLVGLARDLYVLMAELATAPPNRRKLTPGTSLVTDEMVDKTVNAIITAARTGTIGDGKIFISKIDEAIRIRNDERGEIAL